MRPASSYISQTETRAIVTSKLSSNQTRDVRIEHPMNSYIKKDYDDSEEADGDDTPSTQLTSASTVSDTRHSIAVSSESPTDISNKSPPRVGERNRVNSQSNNDSVKDNHNNSEALIRPSKDRNQSATTLSSHAGVNKDDEEIVATIDTGIQTTRILDTTLAQLKNRFMPSEIITPAANSKKHIEAFYDLSRDELLEKLGAHLSELYEKDTLLLEMQKRQNWLSSELITLKSFDLKAFVGQDNTSSLAKLTGSPVVPNVDTLRLQIIETILYLQQQLQSAKASNDKQEIKLLSLSKKRLIAEEEASFLKTVIEMNRKYPGQSTRLLENQRIVDLQLQLKETTDDLIKVQSKVKQWAQASKKNQEGRILAESCKKTIEEELARARLELKDSTQRERDLFQRLEEQRLTFKTQSENVELTLSLQRKVDEGEKKNLELEQSMAGAKSLISSFEETIKEAYGTITGLENEITEITAKNSDATEKITDYETRLDQITQEHDKLLEQNSLAFNQLTTLKERVQKGPQPQVNGQFERQLTQEYRDIEVEVKGLWYDNTRLFAENTDLKAKLSTLGQEHQTLLEKHKSMDEYYAKEVKTLRSSLSQFKDFPRVPIHESAADVELGDSVAASGPTSFRNRSSPIAHIPSFETEKKYKDAGHSPDAPVFSAPFGGNDYEQMVSELKESKEIILNLQKQISDMQSSNEKLKVQIAKRISAATPLSTTSTILVAPSLSASNTLPGEGNTVESSVNSEAEVVSVSSSLNKELSEALYVGRKDYNEIKKKLELAQEEIESLSGELDIAVKELDITADRNKQLVEKLRVVEQESFQKSEDLKERSTKIQQLHNTISDMQVEALNSEANLETFKSKQEEIQKHSEELQATLTEKMGLMKLLKGKTEKLMVELTVEQAKVLEFQKERDQAISRSKELQAEVNKLSEHQKILINSQKTFEEMETNRKLKEAEGAFEMSQLKSQIELNSKRIENDKKLIDEKDDEIEEAYVEIEKLKKKLDATAVVIDEKEQDILRLKKDLTNKGATLNNQQFNDVQADLNREIKETSAIDDLQKKSNALEHSLAKERNPNNQMQNDFNNSQKHIKDLEAKVNEYKKELESVNDQLLEARHSQISDMAKKSRHVDSTSSVLAELETYTAELTGKLDGSNIISRKYSDAKKDIQAIQAVNESLSKKAQEFQDEITRLGQEISRLQKENNDIEKEKQELITELATHKQDSSKLADERSMGSVLRDKMTLKDEQIKDLESQVAKLTEKVKALELEMREKVENLEFEMDEKVKYLEFEKEEKVKHLEYEMEEKVTHLEFELQEKAEMLSTSEIKSRRNLVLIQELEEHKERLEADNLANISQLKKSKQELENKLKNTEEEIVSYRKNIERLEMREKKLLQQLRGSNVSGDDSSHRDTTSPSKEMSEDAEIALSIEIRNLKNTTFSLKQTIQDKDQTIEDLRDELKVQKNLVGDSLQELEKLDKELQNLRQKSNAGKDAQIADLTSQLSKVRSEAYNRKKESDKLETELANIKRSTGSMSDQLAEKEKVIVNLMKDLTEQRAIASEGLKELEILEAEVDQLRKLAKRQKKDQKVETTPKPDRRLNDLELQLEQAKREAERLMRDRMTAEQTAVILKRDNEHFSKKIDDLNLQLAKADADRRYTTDRSLEEAAKSVLNASHRQIDELNSTIKTLQKELDDSQVEIAKLEAERERLTEQIEDLEEEKLVLKRRLQILTAGSQAK